MNEKLIRRWLNEYLDGEIGLADKAELERIMAADERVRREYRQLRQIGLLLGSAPEVQVHPYRFRQKLAARLEGASAPYFTPQRAFAASMLVTLLVITISFAFYAFQQRVLGGSDAGVPVVAAAGQAADSVTLEVPATPEAFFTRLLVEHQLGLQDQSVMAPVLAQTQVYEGSTCLSGNPLEGVQFSGPLPRRLHVDMLPGAALRLSRLGADLTGQPVRLRVGAGSGQESSFEDYIRLHGADQPVRIELILK